MEGGREGGSIYFCFYLYFIFVLEKKTKREGGTRSLSFLREKIPAPSVHASERDTASTLLRHWLLHYTHTHTHSLTYTRILEISSWCCERNPLSSYSYPYSTHTIHSLSTTCIFLPLNRQTKANWPDITRHINHLFRDLPITTAPTSELQGQSLSARHGMVTHLVPDTEW